MNSVVCVTISSSKEYLVHKNKILNLQLRALLCVVRTYKAIVFHRPRSLQHVWMHTYCMYVCCSFKLSHKFSQVRDTALSLVYLLLIDFLIGRFRKSLISSPCVFADRCTHDCMFCTPWRERTHVVRRDSCEHGKRNTAPPWKTIMLWGGGTPYARTVPILPLLPTWGVSLDSDANQGNSKIKFVFAHVFCFEKQLSTWGVGYAFWRSICLYYLN